MRIITFSQDILEVSIYHKDWLTCSHGTYRLGELCYGFFLSQTTLLRCLTFLLGFQSLTITVLLFWIYLLLLMLLFVLQCHFLHEAILILLLSQSPLTLFKLERGCPFLLHRYYYSHADWDDLPDHLRDFLW